MKIRIYPIKSPLHDEEYIERKRSFLLGSLNTLTKDDYEISDINNLYQGDLAMILVESGGSEGYVPRRSCNPGPQRYREGYRV